MLSSLESFENEFAVEVSIQGNSLVINRFSFESLSPDSLGTSSHLQEVSLLPDAHAKERQRLLESMKN